MNGTTERAIREQEARIRLLENDAMLKALESVRRTQETRYDPHTLIATGVGIAAALFGVAVALLKWAR
ncbi:hypothetical protein [Rhodopila sp.]|uniref:hypothetical protein n=1 Tax=Rhodopila sp. TaxID=2480087 RepID=UPI003D0AF2DF